MKNVKRSQYDIPNVALYHGKGFNKFEITDDLYITIPGEDGVLHIPRGFQTDGRSAGKFMWLFPAFGKTGRAWVMHDRMYKIKYKSKELGYWRSRLYCDWKMFQKSMQLHPWGVIGNIISFIIVILFGWILYLKDYWK